MGRGKGGGTGGIRNWWGEANEGVQVESRHFAVSLVSCVLFHSTIHPLFRADFKSIRLVLNNHPYAMECHVSFAFWASRSSHRPPFQYFPSRLPASWFLCVFCPKDPTVPFPHPYTPKYANGTVSFVRMKRHVLSVLQGFSQNSPSCRDFHPVYKTAIYVGNLYKMAILHPSSALLTPLLIISISISVSVSLSLSWPEY